MSPLGLSPVTAFMPNGHPQCRAADPANFGPRGLPPDDGIDLTGTRTPQPTRCRTNRSDSSFARLVGYGVPHTTPEDPDGLESQVHAALAETDRPVEAVGSLIASDLAGVLRAVYGEGFLVVQ